MKQKEKQKIIEEARKKLNCSHCNWKDINLICCNCKTEFPIEELSNILITLTEKATEKEIKKLKQEIRRWKVTCEVMSNPRTMKGITKSLKQIAEGKTKPLKELK